MDEFKPFIHNVGVNVWQVCYLNENNYLSARTFKGRHAEEFAKEYLAELLERRAETILRQHYERGG